ncbi:MAG: aryl-alcohol dehydrogenase-like predicted oxidoreductase [Candidatus Azotimanducaceae bacterium]|jgi:aryl-alcohol dehydrogenase-like predicted oxidoreductase
MAERFVNEKSLAATKAFMEIAEEIDLSTVTLATAWSNQHDFIAYSIVGATSTDQLEDIFAAADLTLTPETMKKIDAVSKEIMHPMG